MAEYQIGEVERLLDVKAHALRYWEKEIPLIQPRKDMGGRRVYTTSDVSLLLRLKHLLYDRRFTIEGARDELLSEMSGIGQDSRAAVEAARAELVKIYFLSVRLRERASDVLAQEAVL